MDKPTDTARLNNLLYFPVSFCLSVCLYQLVFLLLLILLIPVFSSCVRVSVDVDIEPAGSEQRRTGKDARCGSRGGRQVKAAGERLSWAVPRWVKPDCLRESACHPPRGGPLREAVSVRSTLWPTRYSRPQIRKHRGTKRKQIFFFKSRGDYF